MNKCTRLAIHTFSKCDHKPKDGSIFFYWEWKIIHVGCHLVRQLDRLWNVRLTPKLWDSISNVEVRVWATHLFGGDWSHVFCLNFDSPIPKLLKLFVIPDTFKIFRICISWISSHMLTMISWNLFYPRLPDSLNILWKNIENELRVYLSQRVAFQLPMLDFL